MVMEKPESCYFLQISIHIFDHLVEMVQINKSIKEKISRWYIQCISLTGSWLQVEKIGRLLQSVTVAVVHG